MFDRNRRKRYRRVQKHKTKSFKFTDKVHPVKGILSFCFAVLGIITFLILSYVSYKAKGNASLYIGLFGVIALLFSVAGVVLSIMSMRQKDIHYRFPIIGGVLCSALLIGYILMYTLGAIL